jgi:hypothetical protein
MDSKQIPFRLRNQFPQEVFDSVSEVSRSKTKIKKREQIDVHVEKHLVTEQIGVTGHLSVCEFWAGVANSVSQNTRQPTPYTI